MTDIAALVEAAGPRDDDEQQTAWLAALEADAAGKPVELAISQALRRLRADSKAWTAKHGEVFEWKDYGAADEPATRRLSDADVEAAEALPERSVEVLRSIILDGEAPQEAADRTGMGRTELRELLRDAGVSADGARTLHRRGLLAAHLDTERRWTPKQLGKAWRMSFEGVLAMVVGWHKAGAADVNGGIDDVRAVALTMLLDIERIVGRSPVDWAHIVEAAGNGKRKRLYVQPDGTVTWWRRSIPGRPSKGHERRQVCVQLPELRRRARERLGAVADSEVVLPPWRAESQPDQTRKGPKPRGVTARVLARVEHDADGCMTWPGQMIESIPYVWAGDREARYRQVRAVLGEAGGWTPAGGRPRCGKVRCVDRRCCSIEAVRRAA